MGLFQKAKIRITDGGTRFFFQVEVDHVPARFDRWIRAEFDDETVESGLLAVSLAAPGSATFKIGADHFGIATGDRHTGSTEALGVEPIEGFVDLEPDTVGMGMLAEPFVFPRSPMPPGLQMHQRRGFGVSLEGPMARAKIGVREGKGGDRLPTMGTVDFGAKDWILQNRTQHILGKTMMWNRRILTRIIL
jgi:hypothetical protein